MKSNKVTMRLHSLSKKYDIPLWTLRKWASERRFPGINKIGSSIYVNVTIFEKWFLGHEIQFNTHKQPRGN